MKTSICNIDMLAKKISNVCSKERALQNVAEILKVFGIKWYFDPKSIKLTQI